MGTRRRLSGRGIGVGGMVFLVAVLGVALGGVALAGKPQPPPLTWTQDLYCSLMPVGGVYGPTDTWMRMEPDGSGKTGLDGVNGIGMSRAKYGGTFVTVQRWTTTQFSHPDGTAGSTLCVQPVTGGTPLVLVSSALWKIDVQSKAVFRPGTGHRLTFGAVHWETSSSTPVAGIYEITLTVDGSGAITGSTGLPTVCHVACPTWFLTGDGQVEAIWGFDWLDEDTVVWSLSDGASDWDLYRRDVPGGTATLVNAGTHLPIWPVASPDGSRVLYKNSGDGLYEVAATGGTPYLFVARTVSRKGVVSDPSGPEYLDADTIVYTVRSALPGATAAYDVYRMARGGTAVNLTADTSQTVWFRFAR